MKHIEISRWVDLARGLGSKRDRAAVESHLASGCRTCRHTLRVLSEVIRIAGVEPQYEVPDQVVQDALEIFRRRLPESVFRLPHMLANLVFDSFDEPLPAGVRSYGTLTRQTLYHAAGYALDLKLENERGSEIVRLIGQVADRNDPCRSMADLPVMLVAGQEVLATSRSNSLGEFQFEYQPRRRLSLFVETVTARRRIEVPLGRLYAAGKEVNKPGNRSGRKFSKKEV